MTERTPLQPDRDAPLTFKLSPAQIISAYLGEASSAYWGNDSHIRRELVVEALEAENAAGNIKVALAQTEYMESDSQGGGAPEIGASFLCEIQIGDVFVAGEWPIDFTGAGDGSYKAAQEQAEAAFIKLAALAGRRVERKLVVVD